MFLEFRGPIFNNWFIVYESYIFPNNICELIVFFLDGGLANAILILYRVYSGLIQSFIGIIMSSKIETVLYGCEVSSTLSFFQPYNATSKHT